MGCAIACREIAVPRGDGSQSQLSGDTFGNNLPQFR
jgi:hypothetical protein